MTKEDGGQLRSWRVNLEWFLRKVVENRSRLELGTGTCGGRPPKDIPDST